MNIFQPRLISAGLFFLLIFPSGWWLHHFGKPYSAILFNLHKLVALGLFIFLAVHVYRVHGSVPLSTVEFTLCVVTGLLFIATIVSGGLVSIDKSLPAVIPILHKLFPYLTLLSTVVSLYLLLYRR